MQRHSGQMRTTKHFAEWYEKIDFDKSSKISKKEEDKMCNDQINLVGKMKALTIRQYFTLIESGAIENLQMF